MHCPHGSDTLSSKISRVFYTPSRLRICGSILLMGSLISFIDIFVTACLYNGLISPMTEWPIILDLVSVMLVLFTFILMYPLLNTSTIRGQIEALFTTGVTLMSFYMTYESFNNHLNGYFQPPIDPTIEKKPIIMDLVLHTFGQLVQFLFILLIGSMRIFNLCKELNSDFELSADDAASGEYYPTPVLNRNIDFNDHEAFLSVPLLDKKPSLARDYHIKNNYSAALVGQSSVLTGHNYKPKNSILETIDEKMNYVPLSKSSQHKHDDECIFNKTKCWEGAEEGVDDGETMVPPLA